MFNFFQNIKSYFIIIALLFNAWVTPSDHQNASQSAKNNAQAAWFYGMLQNEPLERRLLAIKEQIARTDLCINESFAEEFLLYILYEEELQRGFPAKEEQFDGTIDNQEELERGFLAKEEQIAFIALAIERKDIERSWLLKQSEALEKQEKLLSDIIQLYKEEAFTRELLKQTENVEYIYLAIEGERIKELWLLKQDIRQLYKEEELAREFLTNNECIDRYRLRDRESENICFRRRIEGLQLKVAQAAQSHQ